MVLTLSERKGDLSINVISFLDLAALRPNRYNKVSHKTDENKMMGNEIQKLKYPVDIKNHDANVEIRPSKNDNGNNARYQYCTKRASIGKTILKIYHYYKE
ncbi:MAG: hypothetical protein WCO66_02930 [Candidatus Absconditabacteria bacterium]